MANFFKSAFEKLSGQQQQRIVEATEYTAMQVSPSGELFGVFVSMNTYLKQIANNTDPRKQKATRINAKGAKILGAAMPGIGEGIKLIAEALEIIPDGKDAQAKMNAIVTGVDALGAFGASIFKFSKYLAMSLPLLILGIPALMLAIPMILTVGGVFYLLGKMGVDKEIKDVSTGLAIAGLAMVSLAGGIVLSAMILMAGNQYVSSEDGMGEYSMGLGGAVGMVAALVVGTGIVFAIAGKFSKQIEKGAGTMILATIPILLLAFAVNIFSKAIPPTPEGWETLGQISAVVVGVGLAMAGAGAAAVFIAPGAGAMILAGIALIALSAGLGAIANVFKPGKFDYLLADSGHETEGFLGFGGGRMMSNMEWALLSVARSFALPPLAIAGMYAGAPALIMSGLALVSIAKGIEKFQAMDIDYDVLPDQIAKVTTVLGEAFGKIGKKYPGGGGGFLRALTGAGEGTSAVAQGISAVSGMGKALTGIATGVQSMADLKFPVKWDKNGNPIEFRTLKDEDFNRVTINTQKIITALSGTFGKIGDSPEAKDAWGWFGNSAVEEGIEVVQKMGEPLSNLATFVNAFAKERVDVEGVTNKTRKLIGSLTSIFVNDDGTNLSARDITQYSRAYNKMASSVNSMADGMEDWKDAVNDLDLEKVTEVRKLYEGLAALSNNDDTNIVEEMGQTMVDAIQLLSEKLSEFAGSIKSTTTATPSSPVQSQIQQVATAQNNEDLVLAIEGLRDMLSGTLPVYVTNQEGY